jgi:azurin
VLVTLAALVLLPTPWSGVVIAAPRVIEITGGDDMKYSITEIKAKRGEELLIRLKAVGKMPKVAMQHNFILLIAKADPVAFSNAAALARDTNYNPPALKAQVIAASGMVGNGETVELKFKAPAAPGKYPYVCTFPGHFISGMKGTLIVQ